MLQALEICSGSQDHTLETGCSPPQMVIGKLESACKRMKLDPYLLPYGKLTQNGLYIRPKIIKLLEENTREKA